MADGKVRLGPAAKWTPDDIRRLAEVGETDELAADLLWRRAVQGPLADLLAAVPDVPDEGVPDV